MRCGRGTAIPARFRGYVSRYDDRFRPLIVGAEARFGLQRAAASQLPALLLRPAGIADRHVDADRGAGLAGAATGGQGRRPDAWRGQRAAIRAGAAARGVWRGAGRPATQAQGARGDAERHDAARADAGPLEPVWRGADL